MSNSRLRGSETVGIDLGTTYSALAYMDEQFIPRVMPDSSGQTVIPSVVLFNGADIIVGDIALEQAAFSAENVVQFVKVQMGEEWTREFNGQIHTPESISAMILAHLVREAEPQIGEITQAVITVPAYFSEKRRQATQQAGEIAGLKVVATLNEPMSAALAFGLYDSEEAQTIVVYDLGGGTFDVTVVRGKSNSIEELATFGNRQLGGKDWDQMLIDYVAENFLTRHGFDPRESVQSKQDLILACEQAKRRLGRMTQTSIRVHCNQVDHTCEVTRAQFEDLTAPLLNMTKLTTELALEDAKCRWSDISRVVLVGGSTHMPMVRHLLTEMSGKAPDSGVNPVLAVSLGAAKYAHMLDAGTAPRAVQLKAGQTHNGKQVVKPPDDMASSKKSQIGNNLPSVSFVTAHGVGVRAKTTQGTRINHVLIGKNSKVPTKASFRYLTSKSKHNSNKINVHITQGDTSDIELAEVLGTGEIEIPPGSPSGKPIDVEMQFDPQGRLNVRAIYVETKTEIRLQLHVKGTLTEDDVDRYKSLLSSSGLTGSYSKRASSRTDLETSHNHAEEEEIILLEPLSDSNDLE